MLIEITVEQYAAIKSILRSCDRASYYDSKSIEELKVIMSNKVTRINCYREYLKRSDLCDANKKAYSNFVVSLENDVDFLTTIILNKGGVL